MRITLKSLLQRFGYELRRTPLLPETIATRARQDAPYYTIETVKERLRGFSSITEFREGWIPDTFAGLGDRHYAFAHIDVDLYQPTLDSCGYFYPRLTAGGVMLFDEYGFSSAHDEKVAVDEFFADKPEEPIGLITGQAFMKLSSTS